MALRKLGYDEPVVRGILDYIDSHDTIAKYAALVHEILPTAWTRPLGPPDQYTDDHLHFDLGYLLCAPRGYSEAR